MLIYHYSTPLGLLLLTTEKNGGFSKIAFESSTKSLSEQSLPLGDEYAHDLSRYFRGEAVEFNWPIQLKGTSFQNRVWDQLLKIPYGKTTSYKQIAINLNTKGYQAVGSAIGANPLAIIIPCHRVLGMNNNLTGYRYGIQKKQFLLELERALPLRDFC